MDKLTDIFAAFDAGKLPSQSQLVQFIDLVEHYIQGQAEPAAGAVLSSQGRVLTSRVGEVLDAYKVLGTNKNHDDVLQEVIWHLYQSDLTETSTNLVSDPKDARRDARSMKQALQTLVGIVWSNMTSEGSVIFQDFSSFARLALADAAEMLEGQASSAKESLRQVDEEVQEGKRDTLGRNKERLEEESGDVKVQFEHGMDTLKEAGSSVIGVGQTASAKAEELSDKTSSRASDAFYKICERCQKDESYRNSISTLFDICEKWLTKALDNAESHDSVSSFIEDPTPEQHVTKALQSFKVLLSRFAGDGSLDRLFEQARACALDVRHDDDLSSWFRDFFACLRKSVDSPGYIDSNEFTSRRKDLRRRWNLLLDADSEQGRKWKRDVESFKADMQAFQSAIEHDADLHRVRQAHERLGDAVQNGLREAGSQAETSLDAVMEQVSWFWQDLFKVYIPQALNAMKDLPIPRTEYKDSDLELVLEDLDISSFNILPSHVFIRNITDVDINASTTSTRTSVGALTQIHVQALQLAIHDVSFFYKDKAASVGPAEYSGLLTCILPPKGIDVFVKVRLIPDSAKASSKVVSQHGRFSTEYVSERELRRAFHIVERVDVNITEDIEVSVKDSNHAILLAMFKPIFTLRFRDALQRALEEQIRTAIQRIDSIAWDVTSRAQVFVDTGLGRGSALAAAVWSELGKLRRNSNVAWTTTGTGLVVQEKVLNETDGSEKPGATFAIGAEPQVLSGEKRGPVGTAAEPLAQRLDRVAGETSMDVESAAPSVEEAQNKAKEVAIEAREQAKGIVEEGKSQARSFVQTVRNKAQEEGKRDGWRSDAFSL